jgi:hypothetical protein
MQYRARVYDLREDGTWAEMGTGLARVDVGAAAAAAGGAADGEAPALMRILVLSEDAAAPLQVLADVRVLPGDTLRRNETIITFE